jgi:hypothetical protein
MTPTIYKIAYVETSADGFVLFQNDGNLDTDLKAFETEEELLKYLDRVFEKVGEITDYGLYIRKSLQRLFMQSTTRNKGASFKDD